MPLDAPADYGPSMQRTRTGRYVSAGAGDAVLEDRPDPTVKDKRLLIRGARRRLTLRDMAERGIITKRQHDAAVKFVDDLSLAAGPSRSMLGGLISSPGERGGIATAQCDAIRRVHRVVHLLGLNRDTVFWWIVVDNGTLSGFENRFQIRHGTARRWLMDALDALDRHYFGPEPANRLTAGAKGG